MEIFFQNPNEVPLPPEEVRLRSLHAEPWSDGRRVKIYLEIEPFQKRPSAELSIVNAAGESVAQASILETMARKLELNLHLRQAEPGEEYTLLAVLYYQKLPNADQDPIELPAERLIVDRKQVSFKINAEG